MFSVTYELPNLQVSLIQVHTNCHSGGGVPQLTPPCQSKTAGDSPGRCCLVIRNYLLAGGFGGAGLLNFAASTAAFTCTVVNWLTLRPSVHVEVHLNGTLTPETVR